jgi:Replication initiator protein A
LALPVLAQARRPARGGWSFDLVHLQAKSGSLSPLKHFAYDVRQIVQRQTLPGYQLVLARTRVALNV